ncbi:MAG: TIR domain-containing protein [Sphaerospermopsis sp. SIO1G1]|nr:TIR domain-containing protein [Sphaerospermopsis sp. SIO1G1]
MNLYNAFISYGRADSKAFARKLHENLKAQGLNVWFDQEDIPLAVDFQEQIDDGISKSDNFLFIIAPHSVNSPYCLKEIELAVKFNKRIIPLLHVEQISYETWQKRNPGKTELDWEEYQKLGKHSSFINIHPEISRINWVYFREGIDDFENSLTGLISAIHKHQDYVRKHTEILLQALEWQKNQQQTNYLLVGEERQKAETWLKQKFLNEQPPCLPTNLHCEFICESAKNANNLLTQVFLASAEPDNKTKEKIRKTLMRESITVWTNQTDIKTGSEFNEAIKQGIAGADNFVYLISNYCLKSEYCNQELNQALANNKRIIPLLLENIEIELINPELNKLQFIDFTEFYDEDKYNLSADKLLQEIKTESSYYENHKLLLVKAKKWQRQNQNPSLLLRGYNLQYFESWFKVAQQNQNYPPIAIQEEFINASLNKPEGYSLEVFISYSRTDSDLARKLNDKLQELGKTTWFDQESIATGTDFQKEINKGIEISDNFIFIISPKSVNSPYCADEVEYACKLNKRIVTILHRPLSTADKQKLPAALAAVQWLDFNKHGGEFYTNFNELVRTLDTDREHIRSHTKWTQRSLEWEEKNKSEDLLLRGSEFAVAQEWLKTAEVENKNPPATELQKEYFDKSREEIEAGEKKEQQQILVLRSLLMVALTQQQEVKKQLQIAEYNQAESLARYALSLFKEGGSDLEAIMAAIKAGKIIHSQGQNNPQVLNALQAILYEVKERNILEGHNYRVISVSYSPDGKTLASGSRDKTIKLWDIETGKQIRTLIGHNSYVNSISYSPDGKTLASGSFDNTIILWDVKTGKQILTLIGHNSTVNSISYSPDGKRLASGSGDNTIILWDVKTGKQIRTLNEDYLWIYSVSYSPDGKTLASGSFDNTIKLWDVETGKEIRTFSGHNSSVNSVSFSPDGKTLASGSFDNTIKLWDVETGKEIRIFSGHNSSVNSISYSPDGKTLASGSFDNTIKLWDVKTGNQICSLIEHSSSVYSVSYSPDGKTLASGSRDKTIKLWDIETGKQVCSLIEHSSSVNSVSYSPDGKTLASGSDDKTMKLWDMETGNQIHTFNGHYSTVYSVSFSPDGKTLASGSEDNTIKLWDVETGNQIHILNGHDFSVYSVSFSPDGKTLASGSEDNTIKLWDVETGNQIHTLNGHDFSVYSVSFSPDGKTLASGSDDQTIKLWDVETGNQIRTLNGHDFSIISVSFSPDGKTLASGSDDQTIKLWDVETGNQIRTLNGHDFSIISVSFSPDGKTLASGSEDNTIKLWDVETGKQIRSLTGHNNFVNSVSFSPDGKTLASGSEDGTIKLWNFDLEFLITKNCDFIRGYLENNPNVSESDRGLCEGWYSER